MSSLVVFQALIDGFLIGGVYALIGLGLSLAYGVMGVVNWSHGEFLMVSMFISFLLVKFCGFDPYITSIVTILAGGVLGYILQKTVFNRLLHRGGTAWRDILLFTAGLGLVLTSVFNMIFGAEAKSVSTRYSGMLQLGEIMISKSKAISFAIALVCSIALYYFLQRTDMGRSLRATAQDRSTAQLMGINANRVYCICFAISVALVGRAGSLLPPFYSVSPYVGATFSFKSFIIVCVGGKGNLPGTFAAGLLIGVVEKLAGVFLGDNTAQIIIFLFFILILLLRPNGLLTFKRKGA